MRQEVDGSWVWGRFTPTPRPRMWQGSSALWRRAGLWLAAVCEALSKSRAGMEILETYLVPGVSCRPAPRPQEQEVRVGVLNWTLGFSDG